MSTTATPTGSTPGRCTGRTSRPSGWSSKTPRHAANQPDHLTRRARRTAGARVSSTAPRPRVARRHRGRAADRLHTPLATTCWRPALRACERQDPPHRRPTCPSGTDQLTQELPMTAPMDPDEIRHPDVEVQLTGQDGNAFAVLGAVRKALVD